MSTEQWEGGQDPGQKEHTLWESAGKGLRGITTLPPLFPLPTQALTKGVGVQFNSFLLLLLHSATSGCQPLQTPGPSVGADEHSSQLP